MALVSSSVCPAAESNFATWTAAYFQGKTSAHWGWQGEMQTRLNDGSSAFAVNDPFLTRGNRLLLRLAARWLPHGDGTLQFHLGYGWTPNLSPYRNENRLWQQALFQGDGDDWWWIQRYRFEERWIANTDGVSLRFRHFSRLHRYFTTDKNIGLSLWNEHFWVLNTVGGGPQSGFDQNRVFLGPHFVMSPTTRFEVGYLNLITAQATSRDVLISHLLALNFFVDF